MNVSKPNMLTFHLLTFVVISFKLSRTAASLRGRLTAQVASLAPVFPCRNKLEVLPSYFQVSCPRPFVATLQGVAADSPPNSSLRQSLSSWTKHRVWHPCASTINDRSLAHRPPGFYNCSNRMMIVCDIPPPLYPRCKVPEPRVHPSQAENRTYQILHREERHDPQEEGAQYPGILCW